MEWIPVTERLPDKETPGGFGSPYRTFVTRPVLVKGAWREDYPIVAHCILQEYNDRAGCNDAILFDHPDGYKFYSFTCPYILIDNLGTQFRDKLPVAFTRAVTHWQPLPEGSI